MTDGPRPAPPARRRPPGLGRVLGTFLALLAAVWLAVGLVLAPLLPGGWATLALAALVVTPLPLAPVIRQRARGHYPGRWTRLLLLRPFWYAQLLLLLAGPAALIGLMVGAVAGRPRAGGLVALALCAALFAVGATAGYLGSRRLVVRRLEAHWPDLPAGLDGLRIVQLSDLHVGPHTSRRFLARVARLTRAERPELVAVTGDLVDDHAGDVTHYAAALGDLAAPLGVYAIPGNHDVYAGWPAVLARLRALPLTVLVNDARVVERGGARLAIVGTGDPAGGRGGTATGGPDLDAAFAGVPADAFVVVLAHNPALWPAIVPHGAPLTLSGHTHWGQFALPSLGWSLASPFLEHSMGSYARDGSLLYIHPGTNYWGIPFRLGTPPEVAVVTLRRGEPGSAAAIVAAEAPRDST
ncbi:MAG TPA: metallophosphoesterase [Gemmatimonadaceae bacterium]|nr:metallophosphoesterase [Gemmatimonadaceae bacterium]